MPTTRGVKDVDYCRLAGMSTKAKSKKSSKSVKSDKSTWDQLEVESKQFEDLKEVILKEAEEGLGDTITDTPLPPDIEKDDVFKATMEAHEKERKLLESKKLQLERRQQALDARKQLAEDRHELEACAWAQKLQLKEMEIKERVVYLDLLEKEENLKLKDQEVFRRMEELKHREMHSIGSHAMGSAAGDGGASRPVDLASGRGDGLETRRENSTSARPGLDLLSDNLAAQQHRMGGMSASQMKIQELQQEIARLKAHGERVAPKTTKDTVKQLQEMGLMPMSIPAQTISLPSQGAAPSKEELKKAGLGNQVSQMKCF